MPITIFSYYNNNNNNNRKQNIFYENKNKYEKLKLPNISYSENTRFKSATNFKNFNNHNNSNKKSNVLDLTFI